MKTVIGIDVSKNKLDCLWLRDVDSRKVKAKVFANTPEAHQQLMAWFEKNTGVALGQMLFVMEATGIYHERLAYALHEAGAQVAVVNPAQVRDYAKGIAVRTKTDKKDSLVLALYGAKEQPRLWQPEPAAVRRLKSLLWRLQALEEDIQREQNRLEKAQIGQGNEVVEQSIHTVLEGLDKERQRLEKLIDEHIDNDPQLKQDKKLLQSIPGVGHVLSRYLMSLFRSRAFDSASQMAAFVGVTPIQHQSGSSVNKPPRLSKAGDATLRAKLFMPAIVAARHNPSAMALYERLLARGKSKMAAIGAVMRKLVHICFGVLKHQQSYNPQAA